MYVIRKAVCNQFVRIACNPRSGMQSNRKWHTSNSNSIHGKPWLHSKSFGLNRSKLFPPLVRTREHLTKPSGSSYTPKKGCPTDPNRRRRHTAPCAERRGSIHLSEETSSRVFRPSRDLVDTSQNRVTRLLHQKKTGKIACLFLAQKTRFELVLRFSHTTPLAGEPLEPLGYFCMAHIQKL